MTFDNGNLVWIVPLVLAVLMLVKEIVQMKREKAEKEERREREEAEKKERENDKKLNELFQSLQKYAEALNHDVDNNTKEISDLKTTVKTEYLPTIKWEKWVESFEEANEKDRLELRRELSQLNEAQAEKLMLKFQNELQKYALTQRDKV